MKLFYKVYFFMLILLACILAFSAYVGYLRGVRLFHDDMEQDALILGRSLSDLTEHALQESGVDVAQKLIREANAREEDISIRLVYLTASGKELAPIVSPERLRKLYSSGSISVIVKTGEKVPRLVTYVSVDKDTQSPWALELSESLSMSEKYARHSIIHLLITMAVIFLASGIILWRHFHRWIHQPLVRFIEKSGRIGKGDLTPDLVVEGSDEFAQLAKTLNRMCRDLSDSWAALIVENQHRIEAIEQLRHAERLATVGRLSAGMAHELGTPLNVISGRAKMIYTGELTADEVTECAHIISEQAQRITKLTQDLLDFSRRRKPNRSHQDMAVLVKQVLEILAPSAQKAKVQFDFINHAA